MSGLLQFLLWLAGAAACVIGVTVSSPAHVIVGVLCLIAGEVAAG